MNPLLLAQLNSYKYLRSNVAFCAAAAANKIENGSKVYAEYVYAAQEYVRELGFVPVCVTNDSAKLIQRYLDFCEMWTSEHI